MPNAWISAIAQQPGGALEGVGVCEEHGTRRETFGATSFEATVVLRCPWDRRFEVVWDIYMNNCAYPDAISSLVTDNASAFIASYSIAPAPGNSGQSIDEVIQYMEALITLKYSTDEADAQRLFVQSIEPTLQNLVLNHNKFCRAKKAGGTSFRNLLREEAPAKLYTMYNYTIKWIQQPWVPYEFTSLAGKVNYAPHTIKGIFYEQDATTGDVEAKDLICPPESMLYQPGAIDKSVYLKLSQDPSGDPTPAGEKIPMPGWDYTLRFTINSVPGAPSGVPPVDGDLEGVWNRPFQADAEDPQNFIDYFTRIYRTKGAENEALGDPFYLYEAKAFPVDNGTRNGIHFLPGDLTVVR